MDTLITDIREGIAAGSTDELALDLLVERLGELAKMWSDSAEEIRPEVDEIFGYDSNDDRVNDEIAEQLDACATQVLQIIEDPEHVNEAHPAFRPVGAQS